MKKAVLTLLLVSLLGCTNAKTDYNFKDDTFKVGQKWHYKTRPQDEGSLLTILKTENYSNDGIVVHIAVNGLKLKNPNKPDGYTDLVGHLPVSKKTLAESVTTLESENNKLPDNYKEGYDSWKKEFDAGKAGIFSIPVSEILETIEDTMKSK